MRVWQRAGLLAFLAGLGISIMAYTEFFHTGKTLENFDGIVVLFLLGSGAILFLIGD